MDLFLDGSMDLFLMDLFLACSSSHLEVFCEKGVVINFAKFTGKHKKEKKETPTQMSSCEFCKNSKNTFFTEHLRTIASESMCLLLCMLYPIFYPFFHILSRTLTGYLPLHFLIENIENEYSKLTST